MNNEHLILALKQLPEVKLRLIELARQMVREDGSLDCERAGCYRQEIEAAIGEAEAYTQRVQGVIPWLMQAGRSDSWD